MSQVDVSILEQFNDGSVNLDTLSKLNLSSDQKDIHSSINSEVYQFFNRKLLNFKAFRKSIEVLCEKFGCDLSSPEKNNIEECQFLLYNYAVLEFHCGSYISCHKVMSVLVDHEIGEQLKKNCYALLAECLLRLKRGEECVVVVDKYFSAKGRTNLRDQLGIGESNASRLELQLRIQKLRACMMEKKVSDAETILKELLDAEVESSLLSHLISNLEYLQNNFDVALSLIGQVSNVSSDYRQTGMSYSVIYLNNLGCLFYHLGKTHLAALHFQKALIENQALLKSLPESDTDDSLAKFPLPVISGNLYFEILYNLGSALLNSGKPKQAFACFQNCRLKYKEDPQLCLRLAECCIQAARPENEADFNLNEKKKNLVRDIVGSGSQRKLILNSRVSSLVQNLENAPEGMDFVSGLKYIHTSIQLCNDILSRALTKGKSFLFGNRPGNPIGVQEVLRLLHSSLIAGAFMALTVGEFEMALKFCKDVPQENCSPAQSYLLKLYMAEALVMLSRPEEALPLLNPQNMTSVETSLPKEDGTHRKLPFTKTWYPNNIAVAKCVMQYNMAAALAIRGDLEKSAEIIRLLWIARGNGADIPTQVVALALYIEIKRDPKSSIQANMERRILKLREETVADPWEYEMARSVSSEDNMHRFNMAAGELQTSLGQLFQLRGSPKSAETSSVKKIDDTEEMSLLVTGMASVAMMKKYNRMEKMLLKKSRDQVADARQRVDKQHLQFRNMMYELQYLRTEISKCLDHKSASDEIDLIPEEQFFAEAPASIARPEITRNDPHELWKARLEYELEQRKSFKQEHSSLEKQKKLILAHIKQRKTSLDSLLPKLKEVIEATKPLQEPMGIPKEKILRHADFLKIFPLPMYILYCRIKAYKDAYEPSLMLDIFGDIDELAKQMKEVSNEVAPAPIEIDESELDSQEVSESHVDRDAERRISVSSQQEDISVTTKLRVTIQVAFDLKEGDAKGQMKLLFSYFPKLNIMSVCSTFSSASEGPAISSGDDLLRPSSLLAYLYPSDSGEKMPTLASELVLTGKGIDFADVFAEDRPYVWVQLLAGIDVTAENVQPMSTLNLKKIWYRLISKRC